MFEDGFGMLTLVGVGFLESVYMTLIATFFAYLIGMPLGLFLAAIDKDGVTPMPKLHRLLGTLVDMLRTAPFLILLVAVMPFTRLVAGAVIGPKATIVALLVAAIPFVARMVESSLRDVDDGVVEMAQSMGASPVQIITKVLLPEAKPNLLVGTAVVITTILGYSAMAGFLGGGGLGEIAITYGYYRGDAHMMYVMLILLVVIMQLVQDAALKLSKYTDKRF